MKFLGLIIFNFIQCAFGQNYSSYVCHSFSDYWVTRASNPNCSFSGDVLNSFEQIAWSSGYDTQAFEIETEDEYMLKLFRIFAKGKSPAGEPILLVHPAGTSSTAFTLIGNHSLAFILAEEGYDVWIANLRGTTYSSGHKYLKPSDKRYWNFSFHEYGIYDIKAILHLVTSKTNQKVIYIGYSIGGRANYVYNTVYPQEAIEKLRVSIIFGEPLLQYTKSPLFKLLVRFPNRTLKAALESMFPEGVILRKTSQTTQMILKLCLDSPSQAFLCRHIIGWGFGLNLPQDSPEAFPVTLGQAGEAVPLKLLYHVGQVLRDEQFQQFDYGRMENLRYYGTATPPIYNFSKINVPHHTFYSSGDLLANEENIRLIYRMLPDSAKPFGEPFKIEDENFSHTDFINAKDVKSLLYDHVVQFLKEKNNYFNN